MAHLSQFHRPQAEQLVFDFVLLSTVLGPSKIDDAKKLAKVHFVLIM